VEEVKVTIKEVLALGFLFGLGFGLAIIFYGIIVLAWIKLFFEAWLR